MSNGTTSIAQNLTINTLGAPITINAVVGSSTDKSLTLNADSQANGTGTEMVRLLLSEQLVMEMKLEL